MQSYFQYLYDGGQSTASATTNFTGIEIPMLLPKQSKPIEIRSSTIILLVINVCMLSAFIVCHQSFHSHIVLAIRQAKHFVITV